jgi:hypothetical protein
MRPEVEEVVKLVNHLVQGGGTYEYAKKVALQVHAATPEIVDEALEELERLRIAIRTLKDPLTIKDSGVIAPWYSGPLPGHVYWPALRKTLLRRGFPASALNEDVDPASNKIVCHLQPPGSESIRSRGAVVGYVQSGKTTSFTSVIAKAADAGYRFFVVLSGLHDSLRTQTQERIERDLIDPINERWWNLTEQGDFANPGNANAHLLDVDRRSIAVVKKNKSRLDRLVKWVKSASDDTLRNCPILVVDDEADQASIDVGNKRRSSINDRILKLLTHPKAAYVAYTATPFANLLIDPTDDNLYPRDFIVSLPKPHGHFGTEVIFGRNAIGFDDEPLDGLNVVNDIPSDEARALRAPQGKENRSKWAPSVPRSLCDAIAYFALATAARRARGHVAHSSMLIHTSVYIDAHEALRGPVKAQLDELSKAINTPDGLQRLETLWADQLEQLDSDELARIMGDAPPGPVAFSELRPHLPDVLNHASIVIDNSRSGERLVYGTEPRTVIAIGGNTLSRGLTLEGLVVSYFVRAASAYDTLLQMGRWFGYREGYEDLPRIWMTGELREWFVHLATVEEEIRSEIARYEAEHRTPRELAVRIRTHSAMAVTARAKMRAAVGVKVSYSGERLQTFIFNHRDADEVRANQKAARTLIQQAIRKGCRPEGPRKARPGWWMLPEVPTSLVRKFLANYRFHDSHADLAPDSLIAYIRAQSDRGALRSWNVVVAGRGGTQDTLDLGLPQHVGRIVRAKLNIAGLEHANIKALMSKVDRVADLPELDEEAANLDNSELQQRRPKDKGLLLIYPIDKESRPANRKRKGGGNPRVRLDAVNHLIGVGLVFPSADDDPTPQSYLAAFKAPFDVEDAEEETEAALLEADEREEEAIAREDQDNA